MRHIHLPTVIILGVGIFCGSVASFDMANAIQIYWSGFFAFLILTYFLVLFHLFVLPLTEKIK